MINYTLKWIFFNQDYSVKLLGWYWILQLNKLVKLPYFPIKKYFWWLFSCFFVLICFKMGKCVFCMPKSFLSCLLLQIKVFIKNLHKVIFSWKKIDNPKRRQIMFLYDNFNIKQENIIIFSNVHLRQPPFSSWPKGLKDPSVWASPQCGLRSAGRQIAL